MQQLISQIPELKNYLTAIPLREHHYALVELVRAGLNTLRIPCCKQQLNCFNSLTGEIDRIKENVEHLNHQVKMQCVDHCRCHSKQAQHNTIPLREAEFVQTMPVPQDKTISFGKDQQQVPVKETTTKFRDENVMTLPYNPFAKKRLGDPRLLDDKQVRQALTFPDDPNGPKTTTAIQVMRRSLEHNQHKYQPEIDKEEKVRLKCTRAEQEQTLKNRSRSDYSHIQSKIKVRAERDRALYQQQQKQLQQNKRYQMYEYSDENQMEESSIKEGENYFQQEERQRSNSDKMYYDQLTYNQQYQSSFRESQPGTSSKKAASSHKSRRSSEQKAGFERSSSHRQAASHLEGASDNKSRQSGQPSGYKEAHRSVPVQAPAEQDDDVISNSSSFSQFSISSSRRKQVGKISRRRHD